MIEPTRGNWAYPIRKRITDVACVCPVCGWTGTVGECEPDVDGDGSLGCPKCNAVVETEEQ